jgi:hypothetical protein
VVRSNPTKREGKSTKGDRAGAEQAADSVDPARLAFPLAAQGKERPSQGDGGGDDNAGHRRVLEPAEVEAVQSAGKPELTEDDRQTRDEAGLFEQRANGRAWPPQAHDQDGGGHTQEEVSEHPNRVKQNG